MKHMYAAEMVNSVLYQTLSVCLFVYLLSLTPFPLDGSVHTGMHLVWELILQTGVPNPTGWQRAQRPDSLVPIMLPCV